MAARAYDAMVINRVAVDRFATGLIQRLLPILGVAEGEIEAKLAAYLAKHGTGYDSGTRRQLTRLLAQVRDISRVAHGSLYARLRGEMLDLAKAEVEGAKDLAGRLYGLGTAFNTPTSRVLRQLVEDRPFQGRVLSEWVDGLEQTSFIRFRDAVTQGIVQGEGETEILRRFTGTKALQYKDGVASVGKRMLGAAVRTATAHVHNVSHEAFAKENPELYKGVRWITVLDARACEVCQGYAGEIFPVDEGPRPPVHWNCLPGDALVTTQLISAAAKREYEGQLVVIRTASGLELACTPNHPVLTDGGWLPAQRVDQASRVVCDLRGQREALAQGEHQHRVARIQDVAEPFLAAEMVVAMPVPLAAEDFHGDAAEGQIAVVGAYGLLGDAMQAALGQHRRELALKGRSLGAVALAGEGALAEFVEADGPPARRLVGLGGEALPFLRLCPRHALQHRAGAAPQLDAVRQQDALDGTTRDAEFYGDLLRRPASGVFLDNVVSVERRDFAGHVYNLETENHLIVAQGIVTHNCRCTIENIPIGSPIEAEPTYENWLSEQPEETQVEILGGTAFKLWKEGNLRLREFISDSDPAKALTLAQLKSVRKAAWDRAFGGDITPVRERDISLPTKGFREMDRAFRAANPTVRGQLAGTDLRFVQQQRNGGAVTSEVVEPEVFDQLPGKVVYRGVSQADMVPAQFGPADFVGDGVSGQGVYTTTTVAEATSFGHPDQGGWTYAMKIDPRAKVIERADVEKVLKQHFTEDQLADTALEKNSLLALKGYDVVHNAELGDDHWIILNKKAVVIDKASLPENAAKLLGEEATAAGQKLLEEIAAIEVEKRGLLDEMQAVRAQFKGFELTQENMTALDKLYRPIHEKYARIDERQSELRGRVERMGYGKRFRLEAAYKARYEK